MRKGPSGVKSPSERRAYYHRMIKTPHDEMETFQEKSYDGTDTSPEQEDIHVSKKEHRWRPPKYVIVEKAKNNWHWAVIATVAIGVLTFIVYTSKSIATLEERTTDIKIMTDKISTIDKNVEILKALNEKDGEILDLRIQELHKRIDAIEKK